MNKRIDSMENKIAYTIYKLLHKTEAGIFLKKNRFYEMPNVITLILLLLFFR